MIDTNVVNSKNNTAFLEAAENANYKAFDLLLDSTNVDINAENDKGETAIFLALKNNDMKITFHLVNINLDPQLNEFNLLKSVLNRDNDKKIFYEVNFLHVTKKNENVLHYACMYGHDNTDLVEIFLKLVGIDINLMSEEGTPLYYAFKSRNLKIVEFLLKDPKIKVDRITVLYFYSFCCFIYIFLMMENLRFQLLAK